MTRCADAMGRSSDLNDVSDMFYLEALQKCVSALRAAEHDAEGSGTKSAVADALAVSAVLSCMLAFIAAMSLRSVLTCLGRVSIVMHWMYCKECPHVRSTWEHSRSVMHVFAAECWGKWMRVDCQGS